MIVSPYQTITRNERGARCNQKNPMKPWWLQKNRHPLPPLSRKALSRVEHVRAELASVYRQVRAGKLNAGEASKLTYILHTLARLIEVDDLEKRVDELERKANK